MNEMKIPTVEAQSVCVACGHINGHHLEKCRIAQFETKLAEARKQHEGFKQRFIEGMVNLDAMTAERDRLAQQLAVAREALAGCLQYVEGMDWSRQRGSLYGRSVPYKTWQNWNSIATLDAGKAGT